MLELGCSTIFLKGIIWNSWVQIKVSFLACEACQWKVLTLEQLRGEVGSQQTNITFVKAKWSLLIVSFFIVLKLGSYGTCLLIYLVLLGFFLCQLRMSCQVDMTPLWEESKRRYEELPRCVFSGNCGKRETEECLKIQKNWFIL